MEMIGAGLAALGVFGPGIGIGILTGMSTAAIGRNPDAARADPRARSSSAPRSPRALACSRSWSACWSSSSAAPELTEATIDMPILAVAGAAEPRSLAILAQAEEARGAEFQINLFWIIAQAASFVLFLVIVYLHRVPAHWRHPRGAAIDGSSRACATPIRHASIASRPRPSGLRVLAEARTEAEEILVRAQRVADENRERDLAETRAELEQMRERAAADIVAEKERALAEVRGQVADLALAAAARVVGETMTGERERRLVEEFLAQMGKDEPGAAELAHSS